MHRDVVKFYSIPFYITFLQSKSPEPNSHRFIQTTIQSIALEQHFMLNQNTLIEQSVWIKNFIVVAASMQSQLSATINFENHKHFMELHITTY